MTRVRLEPVSVELARAVVAGDLSGVDAAPGWPHADTLDALRMLTEAGGVGTFLVVETETGRAVGDCGWFGPPGDDGDVEIGYGIASPSRRKGYATEAVTLLLAWVAGQPGVRRVTAHVEATNVASRRVAERAGMTVDASEDERVRYVLPIRTNGT